MTEISQELAQRMAELVRCLSKTMPGGEVYLRSAVLNDLADAARAIVADMPDLVDSDMLLAREIVKETLDPANHAYCDCRREIDRGEWDKGQKVRAALAALRRGKAIGRQDNLGGGGI
jgi:hypothetical protein